MTEHTDILWRVETTAKEKDVFYVLACCLLEAAEKASAYLEGRGDVDQALEIRIADGDLVVEGDDEGEPDDIEKPPGAKEAEAEAPRASRPN